MTLVNRPVNLDRFRWTCGKLDQSLEWLVRSGQKVKPTNYRMKVSLKIDVIIIDYHIAKFAQFFKSSLSQSSSLFAIWSEPTNRVRNDVTDFLFISQQTTWSHKRSLIGQIKQLKEATCIAIRFAVFLSNVFQNPYNDPIWNEFRGASERLNMHS